MEPQNVFSLIEQIHQTINEDIKLKQKILSTIDKKIKDKNHDEIRNIVLTFSMLKSFNYGLNKEIQKW